MAKVINSSDNMQAFCGLNFVSDHFDKIGMSNLVDEHLGKRSVFAKYSFGDGVKNMWMLNFSCGDCAMITFEKFLPENKI